MLKHSTSTDSKVLERIRGHRRGWVFTPAHLADLGSRNAVASALKRFKADGGMRSGLPLLFDGIIGQVEYDSISNTDDSTHFPRNWEVGQAGELMSKRWLSVDEIAAHLGVNPNTISKGVTRKSMPAHTVGRLWKFPAPRLAVMNLALRGIEADFGPEHADTFRRDLHPDLRADLQMANAEVRMWN